MGLAAVFFGMALAVGVQEAAPSTQESPAVPAVTVPPALPANVPPPVAAAPEPVKAAAPHAIPVEEPRRASRPLEEKPEAGPSVGGFVVGSFAVVGCLGGAFLLLRRFGRSSRLLGGGNAIQVLARRALGPRQEILLVEVGSKVFMIGSTKDHLSALGEIAAPDEVALLRASLPERRGDSHRMEFNRSLREGLSEEEKPREERVFASIADELAEIRKTVRAWRA